MIRSLVTFLNKHSRNLALSPTEIIESRATPELQKILQYNKKVRDINQAYEQKCKARWANADKYQAQRLRLRYQFVKAGSRMTQQQYEEAFQKIEGAQMKEINDKKQL